MKITRKEDKFILGSTVVDSTVLKGTPGLEKQLLTNALNLLKFPQRFGLTQDKGKELKFTSDIEQSGRILDVFSDAVWEYNPKTTVYEKKGKLSEVFNNKSIIFNENTGKTYYLKDGKFKKISDLNFKVSRGDEVVRELENRVQDVEKRMGDSGNRFSIVSALPANPDKDTLYIVVGEGQIEDTELQGMDLTELTAKISECITSNLNLTTIVNTLQSGENAQNERMDEINNSFEGINTSIASNTNEITSLKSRVQTNETAISTLRTDLGTANTTLSVDIQKNTDDIADIKEDLQNLASSDTITSLDNRLTIAETDISSIKAKNSSQDSEIDTLKTKVQNLEGIDTDYRSEIDEITSHVTSNAEEIEAIKGTIATLGSNEAIVNLGNRIDGLDNDKASKDELQNIKTAILETVTNGDSGLSGRIDTNANNITHIQEKIDSLGTSDIEGLQEYIENNSGHIEIVQELPENPNPETLYLISGENDPKKITYQDLVECRETCDNALSRANETAENVNSALGNFETSIQSITSKNSDQDNKIEALELKDSEIDGSLTTVNTKINTLEDTQSSHSVSIATLQSLVQAQAEQIQNLKTANENKSQLISDLRTEVDALTTDCSSKTAIIQAFNTKIQNLEGQNTAKDEVISDLQTRLKAVEDKLAMIGFDSIELGGNTYELVIKNLNNSEEDS